MKRRSLFFGLAALGVVSFGSISTSGAAPGLVGPVNLMDSAKTDAGILLAATGDPSSSYQLAATPPAKKADDKKAAVKKAAPKKPRMTAKKRAAAAKAKAEQEAKAKAAAAAAAKVKADADRRAKCDADAGCRFGRTLRCRVFTGGEGGKADICV